MKILQKLINKIVVKYLNNFRSIDNDTIIGDYTFIGKYTGITKSKIGRYCSIGTNVLIGPGEHKLDKFSTSACFYKNAYNELTQKDVIIGNDVWIGSYSIILRGIKIGNGAIIGAGAVVTKDVPDFAVVVGVPAKIIKYRFNEETIRKINLSKWWNYNIDEAKKITKSLELV